MNPYFAISGNNFFLSYDVFKNLNISFFQKLKMIEVRADDAIVKIKEDRIGLSTNGDGFFGNTTQKTQSFVRISLSEYVQLKKSLIAFVKEHNLRAITYSRMIWDDNFTVKEYSLFVKNTSDGFKIQNKYRNY